MHFQDLDRCVYHNGPLDSENWAVQLQAVGWLEAPNLFPVGAVPTALVTRLNELAAQTRRHFPHYEFRGIHECSLCGPTSPRPGPPSWSQENLLIPGQGVVYAAPGGVVHYITAHGYVPPPAFIAAAMSCPDCGSAEYLEALRASNGGQPPPIESAEEFAARIRRMLEEALASRGRPT